MTETKIASWQYDTDVYQSTQLSPFHFTVVAEISKAIMAATSWVDNSDVLDVEYWKRYRVNVHKAVETNWIGWDESPDNAFGQLWVYKYNALIELYVEIHTLYVKYGVEPYQSDAYKEKVEQAIDWLSVEDTDLANFPLLQVDCDIFNITPEVAAVNIMKKRASWIDKMAKIERIRIPTKRDILILPTTKAIGVKLKQSVDKLRQLDLQWI